MFARLLLFVLVVLAAVPSNAQAGPPPAERALTSRLAVDSLKIAAAFWRSDLSDVRVFAVDIRLIWAATGNPSAAATADAAMRAVWIAEGSSSQYLVRIAACSEVVHEAGHVLGVEHSAAPRSIMGTELSDREVVYECYRRFLPPGKMREWRENADGPAIWMTR